MVRVTVRVRVMVRVRVTVRVRVGVLVRDLIGDGARVVHVGLRRRRRRVGLGPPRAVVSDQLRAPVLSQIGEVGRWGGGRTGVAERGVRREEGVRSVPAVQRRSEQRAAESDAEGAEMMRRWLCTCSCLRLALAEEHGIQSRPSRSRGRRELSARVSMKM